MQKNNLQLLNYSVDKIHFDLNQSFDFGDRQEISLDPILNRKIEKIDENRGKVSLGFIIRTATEPLPFEIEIWISGIFELENWEKENSSAMKVNAVAILFTFIRALVATVTSNASVSPYILPVFNAVAWFEEAEKKQKEQKKMD